MRCGGRRRRSCVCRVTGDVSMCYRDVRGVSVGCVLYGRGWRVVSYHGATCLSICAALCIFFSPFPPAVLRRELLVVGFGGGLRCEEQHHPHAVQEGRRGHSSAVGSRSRGGRAQGWPSNQTAETIISVIYLNVMGSDTDPWVVLELHGHAINNTSSTS